MRFLWIALVLLSSAASATTLTLRVQERENVTVGPSDCAAQVPVTWTVTNSTGQACEDMKLWVTEDSTCGSDPDPAKDLVLISVPAANVFDTSLFRNVSVEELPVFAGSTTDAGSACGNLVVEQEHRVCGKIKVFSAFGACDVTASLSTPPTITYDSVPPAPPSITAVQPLDGALSVSAEPETTDTTLIRVQARKAAGEAPVSSKDGTDTQGTYKLEGLENGVTYQVTAQAEDAAGNVSADSAAQEGTPVKTSGLYGAYVAAGGAETGGCGAAGGGIAGGAVLAALGLWLFSRRKRSWLEQ